MGLNYSSLDLIFMKFALVYCRILPIYFRVGHLRHLVSRQTKINLSQEFSSERMELRNWIFAEHLYVLINFLLA